jgi:DNA-binding transcriptional LysR family regulator
MAMRTRDFELLNHLIRFGSVSEAARAMNTTQPNASKMLKKIEAHFGLRLFERVNGRLHPTEEARLIAGQAESALISLRRLDSLARDLREMRHGSLTVGATPQLSRDWAPSVVADYMSRHPGVAVTVQTRNSRQLVELVAERQLDVALGLLAADDPNVVSRRLFAIDLLAALPSGHPLCDRPVLEARDFDGLDFITASMLDNSRDRIETFFAAQGARPAIRGEASLSCTRLGLVERGLGLSFVDALSAEEYAGDAVAFRPVSPRLTLTVWMMRARTRPASKVVDSFAALVSARAAADVRGGAVVSTHP